MSSRNVYGSSHSVIFSCHPGIPGPIRKLRRDLATWLPFSRILILLSQSVVIRSRFQRDDKREGVIQHHFIFLSSRGIHQKKSGSEGFDIILRYNILSIKQSNFWKYRIHEKIFQCFIRIPPEGQNAERRRINRERDKKQYQIPLVLQEES